MRERVAELGSIRECEVVVVGAGPVGLSLAIDLQLRGIDVVVCEQRRAGEQPAVKCNHVSARTMEVFRRFGCAGRIRDAGLPRDFPHDVAYRTSMTGIELARIQIPSRRNRFTATDGPDTGWPTPEPPHRINQIYLEPILYERALEIGVEIHDSTLVESIEQDDRGATVRARFLDSDGDLTVRGRYLVGCDGGDSLTRRTIGAQFLGDGVVQCVQSTLIRAPKLLGLLRSTPAWGNFSLNPRRCGMVYAIDGRELWVVHNYINDDESFEEVPRDASLREILGVGLDFEYDVVSTEDWVGRRLVADRFRDRRIFLCGDAAHIWTPFAGYGMNAGIADAMNLSWMLAATLGGWASESILDAYEAERRPITEQVSHFAMGHARAVAAQRREVPDTIEDPGPAGDRIRNEVGQEAYHLNVDQYCAAGLNFAYFYDASPIICYDDGTPPPYTMAGYEPTTVPGCRTPHVWLAQGASLYDELGPGYALVVRDPEMPVDAFVDTAARRGVPFRVVLLSTGDTDGPYDRALVLSRPDQHVAWRGDAPPSDIEAVFDRVLGFDPQLPRSTGSREGRQVARSV